jgi:hypothetical protein
MIKQKWSTIGIATLLLLVIAGCGDKPTAAPANVAEQDSSNSNVVSGAGESTQTPAEDPTDDPGSEVASTPQPTPVTKDPATEPSAKPVVDEKQKQSQSIEVYYTDSQIMDLVPAKTSISFSNDVEKYIETFKALQSSENKDLIPLWGKIELKSLKFVDGQIVMDIHKPDEAQLGAGGESFAITSLAKTYFQFEEVKSIEVLVDGEKVESLMGHVDLLHPMTRENS